MKKLFKNAALWRAYPTPAFTAGELLVEGDVIVARGDPDTLPTDGAVIIDLGGALVAPGLVDIHTHGRAGGDFTSADTELLTRMAQSYLASGTTTVMPTLASAPLDDYAAAASRISQTAHTEGGARWVGLHLEGRYLHPDKRGAHARELLAPLDGDELTALVGQMGTPSPMRLTAALETDTDGRFAEAAKRLGLILSLGHTTASYTEAREAIVRGVRSFTHTYNAMPPLHHRDGGAIAALFDAAARGEDVFGELICDGLHISPEMIRLAYRQLGRDHTLLVTDSMEGAGCPDGHYTIAGLPVTVKDGRAVTSEGALAGSTLSLWQAVCNLATFCEIPLAEALYCATYTPARLCGLQEEIGTLEVGARADMIVIDPERQTLLAVWLAGEKCAEVTPK